MKKLKLALPVLLALAPLAHADNAVVSGSPDSKVKLSGLLQFWGLNDTTLSFVNSPNRTDQAITNFRFRRAEIQLNGSVVENSSWLIMIDPSKVIPSASGTGTPLGDAKILQDALMTYNLTSEITFTVGQFRIPTTAEGRDPDAELPFFERSMVARNFGEYRDQGAMLSYTTPFYGVSAMIANGHGTNQDDYNPNNGLVDPSPNRKALHLRGDILPGSSMTGGVFTTLTNFSYAQKSIWGANFRIVTEDGAFLRFEGVLAKDYVDGPMPFSQNAWVIDGGYQWGSWQPVARFETQQGITTTATGIGPSGTTYTGTAWTVGLNYYISKNKSKIQFAFAGLNKIAGSGGATTATGIYDLASTEPYSGALMVLAYQMAF